jgi:hypothetical protein
MLLVEDYVFPFLQNLEHMMRSLGGVRTVTGDLNGDVWYSFTIQKLCPICLCSDDDLAAISQIVELSQGARVVGSTSSCQAVTASTLTAFSSSLNLNINPDCKLLN